MALTKKIPRYKSPPRPDKTLENNRDLAYLKRTRWQSPGLRVARPDLDLRTSYYASMARPPLTVIEAERIALGLFELAEREPFERKELDMIVLAGSRLIKTITTNLVNVQKRIALDDTAPAISISARRRGSLR